MIYVLTELDVVTGTESGYIKIGYVGGSDVSFLDESYRRSNELQCGNPRKLVIVGRADGCRAEEASLHKRFHASLVSVPRDKNGAARPTEWFRLGREDLRVWLESVRVGCTTAWADVVAAHGPWVGRQAQLNDEESRLALKAENAKLRDENEQLRSQQRAIAGVTQSRKSTFISAMRATLSGRPRCSQRDGAWHGVSACAPRASPANDQAINGTAFDRAATGLLTKYK